ncbi:hypothetical protein Daus18300_004866 [Diaporthe australafricana]|uniref:Ankyrin repeat protein n=1 Tax=Diaporthe australafricana TaxID=127596 RepID=A0ABR3X5W6_9PEZI
MKKNRGATRALGRLPVSAPRRHQGTRELIDLIKLKDASVVREYMENDDRDNCNARDHHGLTALHWAAKLGLSTLMEIIIGEIRVDITDMNGRTALFYAVQAEQNNLEAIELLITNGADVAHHDHDKETPLLLAAVGKKTGVVKRLVGSDDLALIEAIRRCERNHDAQSMEVQTVQMLVDCGANVHVLEEGSNVLHVASTNGCLAVVRMFTSQEDLVEQKDSDGWLPIHLGAYEGWRDVVECILGEYSADIEARNSRGWTTLHIAASRGLEETVSVLVGWGGNTLAKTTKSRSTSLFISCLNSHDGVAMLLLDKMEVESFRARNGRGQSVPFAAAQGGCTKTIQCLIEYARQDNTLKEMILEDAFGSTPAYSANAANHPETAEVLIENGASTEGIDANGNCAIHWASIYGMTGIVAHLLNRIESNESLKNMEGYTPVQLAAKGLHYKTVATMLSHANPQRTTGVTTTGWTGLNWAAQHDRLDLVRLMAVEGGDKVVRAKDARGLRAADIARSVNTRSIEMLEWLTLAKLHKVKVPKSDLGQPQAITGAEPICKNFLTHLVDVYPRGVIEKTGFSVFDVIYERGPNEILSAVAKARRMEEKRISKWIYLPANNETWINDLIQSAYFERTTEMSKDAVEATNLGTAQFSTAHVLFPPRNTGFIQQSDSELSSRSDPGGSQSDSKPSSSSGPGGSEPGHIEADAIAVDGLAHPSERQRSLEVKYNKAYEHGKFRPWVEESTGGHNRNPAGSDVNESRMQAAVPNAVDANSQDTDTGSDSVGEQANENRRGPSRTLQDQYYRLRTFVDDSLSQESGSRPYPFVQPFFKANNEVYLLNEFKKSLETRDLPLPGAREHQKKDGVLEEIELLIEVKGIIEELTIIKTVLLRQKTVIDEAFSFLENAKHVTVHKYYVHDPEPEKKNLEDLVAYYGMFSKLDLTRQEVDKLHVEASLVLLNINQLLDLRHKAATLSEAIWARKASEDTTRQGRTIMVFTVTTIIFLPITFLASLLAIDITSFPHNDAGNLSYSPQWAFSRLFGITLAVSLPLIFLAFKVNEASDFFSGLSKRKTRQKEADAESEAASVGVDAMLVDAGARRTTLRERFWRPPQQRGGEDQV